MINTINTISLGIKANFNENQEFKNMLQIFKKLGFFRAHIRRTKNTFSAKTDAYTRF